MSLRRVHVNAAAAVHANAVNRNIFQIVTYIDFMHMHKKELLSDKFP